MTQVSYSAIHTFLVSDGEFLLISLLRMVVRDAVPPITYLSIL